MKLRSKCSLNIFHWIYFFDLLFGMTAKSSTIREVVGIVDRARGHSGGQNKTVVGINSGMLFQAIMRLFLLYDPIRVKISMEFKRACPVTNYI